MAGNAESIPILGGDRKAKSLARHYPRELLAKARSNITDDRVRQGSSFLVGLGLFGAAALLFVAIAGVTRMAGVEVGVTSGASARLGDLPVGPVVPNKNDVAGVNYNPKQLVEYNDRSDLGLNQPFGQSAIVHEDCRAEIRARQR